MSEGGLFHWKLQKLVSRGPAGDYSGLRDPLPEPPEGMRWHQDKDSREWKLVAVDIVENNDHTTGAESSNNEDDWELLSDKEKKAGSVRSLSSMESGHHSTSSHLSVPFKIQRTHSSSTIDSSDNCLGPSGKGVLGVDYVEHVVLPTDTLQGICLAYKVNSTRLRQANHFSGNSLLMAPKKLVIPISKKALRSGFIRVQDTDAKEYKLHAFLAEFPDLSITEVKAYLELADWNLKDAIKSAKEDLEWEHDIEDADALRAGQIRITLKSGRFNATGAGIASKVAATSKVEEDISESEPAVVTPRREPPRVATKEEIPDIATKTVKAHDVYKAAPQHESYGLELKSLRQPLLSKEATHYK